MKKLYFLILFLLIGPFLVFAAVGVGVGTGKIVVDKPLKPGGLYNLPPLTVFNTGDEKSEYIINVAYHTDQPQLRPDKSWFIFEPYPFSLGPAKSQVVTVKLNLPLKITPGDYFAYLEAKPVTTGTQGTVTIGIAAASKLYFSVAPANIFQAITWRISTFWKMYVPWTWIVFSILIFAVIIVLFRKFFKFQVGISKK